MKKNWKKLRIDRVLTETATANHQAVHLTDSAMIEIDNPVTKMTKQQALYHAAYLVILADDSENCEPFIDALTKVKERMAYESQKK